MTDTKPAEPRGARDLAALWRDLPVSIVRYRMRALPDELALASLADHLRSRAWRERCAAETPCAAAGRSCARPDRAECRADALFPVQLGGGAAQWRMATLFVQWRPRAGEMRLVALGEAATAELDWAATCLDKRYGLRTPDPTELQRFADFELTGSERWRVSFVTPWVVGKFAHAAARSSAAAHSRDVRRTTTGFAALTPPDQDTLLRDLRKSMATRAQKFTALCAREPTWQRIAAHLARYAAEALPTAALQVETAVVAALRLPLESRGNAGRFDVLAWTGEVVLRVAPPALPWLSLLALCGGGENADKGFGVVEVTAESG